MHSVYFLVVLSLFSPSLIANGFVNPTFLSSKVAVSLRNTIEVRVYASGKEEEGDEDLFLAIQDKHPVENASDYVIFQGAGKPRPDLKPEEIVPLLMTALQKNDFPEEDATKEFQGTPAVATAHFDEHPTDTRLVRVFGRASKT